MKKLIHIAFLAFGVLAVIGMIIWLTRSCEHETEVKSSWIIDSLKYYKNRAEVRADSANISQQQYEKDFTQYNNPDSAGRELLRARIWKDVQSQDSLRKRTP